MSAWRTAFAGMLSLAVLEAVVSSDQAAGRFGGLLKSVGTVIEHLLSPTVPAIPDLRKHGGAIAQSAPGTGTGGAVDVSMIPPDWTTKPAAPPLLQA